MTQGDSGGITCEGIEKYGTCPENKIPSLNEANQAFWRVFDRILPGLCRGSNYDYGAIKLVFEISEMTRHRQAIYLDQCLAVIDVLHKIRKSKK